MLLLYIFIYNPVKYPPLIIYRLLTNHLILQKSTKSAVGDLGLLRFSLRLGHARVLTVHRTVIHYARAAPLRHPLPKPLHSSLFTLHSSLFTLHSSLFTLHFSLPYRLMFVCNLRLFLGRPGGRPLQRILLFTVGDDVLGVPRWLKKTIE